MDQSAFRSSWIEIISGQNFTHFVTLHWNRGAVGLDQMRRDLKTFHRCVDRSRLGSRFWRKPIADRSVALFFIEKHDVSAHAHSFWKAPSAPCGTLLEGFLTEETWRAVVGSGTILSEPIHQIERAASYSLKAQHVGADVQAILFSESF